VQRAAVMNEEALVASARRGDISAFNHLVLAYQELAYNVAYRILGGEERAMDATQDAFLRGYRALDQFRGGSFKVWILRIVTNCCYDQLRAVQRRPTTSIDDLIENDEHSRIFEDPAELPEARVERRELDATIQAGLDTLPEDQRIVVVMSDIDGMSYEEIAQTTSVSLGTIKSRLSRGRAKLRDYLLARRELLPNGFRLKNQ
jgi:RNA polymerase sigma factor (sigma-70 family)